MILLTNDDGIDAPGLRALAEALRRIFPITVVAPDRERSAVSHAVTFRKPLHVERCEADYPAFAVDGTPADCVKIAILTLLDEKPDFLVSGINRGINVGNDVLYSGTVAGAMEGAFHGIPSLAVSLESFIHPVFEGPADFARGLVEHFIASPPPASVVLNVNLPDGGPVTYRGIRWTRQQGCLFLDTYKERIGPDGRTEYVLDGMVQSNHCLDAGSDGRAVREGYVSITPLTADYNAPHDLDRYAAALPPLEALLEKTRAQRPASNG